jgi:hypothetical protein
MTAEVKAALTPVIEIPPIPRDFGDEQPAMTIDAHLEKVNGANALLCPHMVPSAESP